jgi:hypothetical protein
MPADAVVSASRIDETKTRKSNISLMGSIVAVLGEPIYNTNRFLLQELGNLLGGSLTLEKM